MRTMMNPICLVLDVLFLFHAGKVEAYFAYAHGLDEVGEFLGLVLVRKRSYDEVDDSIFGLDLRHILAS